jgi:hypothetical protein
MARGRLSTSPAFELNFKAPANECRRIFDAPVRCHELSRPDGAGFAGGLVAHRKDEVEGRTGRPSGLIPALERRSSIGRSTSTLHD